MITFINSEEVKPKADIGFCYLRAGFEPDGKTEGGLFAFRLPPEKMPEPHEPETNQGKLF